MKIFLIISIFCLGLIACGGGGDSPKPLTIEEQYNIVSIARTCYVTNVNTPNYYFLRVYTRSTKEVKAVFGPFALRADVALCVKDISMLKIVDTSVYYMENEFYGVGFP
jgi:hypothetical protein